MRWLKKDRSSEVWESAADHPNGDIGTAHKIRANCALAESIADAMSGLRGHKAKARKASEGERYQTAIKCALELAKQISDAAMRDASVSQIIGLSINAGHMKTASVLLRAISSENTKAELMAKHRS
jgi:hypothetical protein